jgi:hypothetical protein
MSDEPPKRGGPEQRRKPASAGGGGAASEPVKVTRNNSGRVIFDERGNAVWQWAVSTGELGLDGSTARLTKLDNGALALADDAPPPSAIVKPNPKGVVQGYSPYDSGLLEKKKGVARKTTDLRRLGEYFKLRRQASANRQHEDKDEE